jgi:hypothetical protein
VPTLMWKAWDHGDINVDLDYCRGTRCWDEWR